MKLIILPCMCNININKKNYMLHFACMDWIGSDFFRIII